MKASSVPSILLFSFVLLKSEVFLSAFSDDGSIVKASGKCNEQLGAPHSVFISLEGNLGAGKSTFLKVLRTYPAYDSQ